MKKNKKSIGNEQPLPVDIINDSIIEYLEKNDINKDELLLKIKARSSGENRAKKAANAIYSLVTKKSSVGAALSKSFTAESYSRLSEVDKNVIVMSLICLRFPFNYDLLEAFAKLFNVQEFVNRKYIVEKMAATYGSNLSLEHGISAALKIATDLGFIKREKPGLYSKGFLALQSDFAREAWICVLKEMSGIKDFSPDELKYEPVMIYLAGKSAV